jgi:1-acyl-sn-glycerol-3-phosphate acyltransferase
MMVGFRGAKGDKTGPTFMNRYPIAKPPRWWSPKPSVFWMRLCTPLRNYKRRREDRLRHVDVHGLEHVRAAIARGHGVLITPNHPGHSDCYLLWEALCRLRSRCYVMTTWQVFQMARPLDRWHYRLHGCFSIDRDGNDRQAFRTAVEVLADTTCPLVIFPEGEVYHLNERVMPFREGTTAIAQAAVKRSGRPVECIPCALKYRFLEDPTTELGEVLDRVERTLGERPPRGQSLAQRVQAAVEAFVRLREREYFGQARHGPLQPRIDDLTSHVLAAVDARYGVSTEGRALPERVKRLRQLAVERMRTQERADEGGWRRSVAMPPHNELGHRLGSAPATLSEDPQMQRDLEDVFRCVQLYSYPADYIPQRPTIERVAETVDKLEEDVLGAPTATFRRAVRAARITFGEPTVVTERGDREGGRALLDLLRRRVQQLLDSE